MPLEKIANHELFYKIFEAFRYTAMPGYIKHYNFTLKWYVEQEQQNTVLYNNSIAPFFFSSFLCHCKQVYSYTLDYSGRCYLWYSFYGKRHINQIITTPTIELCYDVEFMFLDLQKDFVDKEFLCTHNSNLSFYTFYALLNEFHLILEGLILVKYHISANYVFVSYESCRKINR